MPGQTTERAVETCVEEILVMRGGSRFGSNAETAKLDALLANPKLAVERLQEYRPALITAAVTGKIDVRAVKR